MSLSRQTRQAAARYGPLVNHLARNRYGVSGQTLLRRLVIGESGDDPHAVSPVGARGRTQFMPGTRADVLRKYGIDPWRSADEAVHAAALHLLGKVNGSKGLEGYNPGDPGYAQYILSQRAGGHDLPVRGGSQHPGVLPGTTRGPGSSPPSVGQVSALTALLEQSLGGRRQLSGASAPSAPSFAAGPTLARDAIQTTGAPARKGSDLQSALAAVQALQGTDLPASQGSSARPVAGASGALGGGPGGKATTFDGKTVRSDFAKQLAWARAHGWKGSVTSGYRTKAQQLAAAKHYGLQHYPNGPLASNHVRNKAVDVTDPAELDKILRRYPGKRTLIWGGPVIGDAPHFSVNGH
jgi:hypothetical protein